MVQTHNGRLQETVNEQGTVTGDGISGPATLDPIDILMKEHEEGMSDLGIISQAAKSIQVDGFSARAFQEMATAVRAIADLISRHNNAEETLLFPLLERHTNAMPGTIMIEHREVTRTFRELLRSINDIEEGRIHGSSIRELLQLANFVVSHLGNHMTKENTVLFPLAKRLLTNEEYEKLRLGIARSSAQA